MGFFWKVDGIFFLSTEITLKAKSMPPSTELWRGGAHPHMQPMKARLFYTSHNTRFSPSPSKHLEPSVANESKCLLTPGVAHPPQSSRVHRLCLHLLDVHVRARPRTAVFARLAFGVVKRQQGVFSFLFLLQTALLNTRTQYFSFINL